MVLRTEGQTYLHVETNGCGKEEMAFGDWETFNYVPHEKNINNLKQQVVPHSHFLAGYTLRVRNLVV